MNATAELAITEEEFGLFQSLLYERVGIALTPAKKALVGGRLAQRLRHHRLESFDDYYRLLIQGANAGELQVAIDLLTTNETRFFREPVHFDFLSTRLLPAHPRGRGLRVWSAACSTGEEPYSIAMVLAEALGESGWEVLGSDISTRVLGVARAGIYPLSRTNDIPRRYLASYCLRGTGACEGKVLIDRRLRERVRFEQVNLNGPIPDFGEFDVIFLRNVMIYFNAETKRQVLSRLVGQLKHGGHLFVGHCESLHGLNAELEPVAPATYCKP